MKKILSLFALVLMSCMGAWAFEAGTYTIKPYSDQTKFVVPSASWAATGGNKTAYAAEATNENGGEWAIAANGSKFYFSPANTSFARGYLNPWSSNSNSSGAIGCWSSTDGDDIWTITAVEGLDDVYTISGSNSTYMYYNSSASELYYNKPGTPAETNYFVIEKVAVPAKYVTFTGQATSRGRYLYNDLTKADGYTLAATTQASPLTNAFIWRVEDDGTHFNNMKNGQGQDLAMYGRHSDGNFSTNAITYTENSDSYYLYTLNATGMKSGHTCLNQSDGSYKNSENTPALTSWNTSSTSAAAATDNHWAITEVTDMDFYNVVITDGVAASGVNYSVASYANYDGQHAANSGFFAVAKNTVIEANEVTVTNVPSGKRAVVAVADKTITVTFEDLSAPIEVTYIFTLGGEEIGRKVVTEHTDLAPTVESTLPSYARIVSGLPTTVTNTEYTLETAHQNLPFALGDDHRYYINLWGVSTRHYLLYANSSNAAVKETKQDQTSVDPSALDDDVKFQHMWVVGGDWFNGFTFQNLLGYYIAAPSTTPSNGDATEATKTESPLCHFDPFFQTGLSDYSFRPHNGSNNFAHTSDASKSLSFYNAYSGENLKATTLHFIDANADYDRLTAVKLTNPNPTGASGLDNKYVATFSCAYDVTLPTGVVAYTAAIEGSTVNFNELGSVVPANTGVLLYAAGADATVNEHFALYNNGASPAGANAFVAVTNGTIAAGKYVLGNGANGVGFYARITDSPVVQNKAYLEVPAGSNLNAFRFDFEGGATGIETVTNNSTETVFDLQGRRVQGAKSGLYIVNGKKVIR